MDRSPRVAPVEITFLPEDRGLTSMIEAMKQSPRAYALFDLARLVLNKPERHLVKLTRTPAADGSRSPIYLVIPSENPFLTQEEAVRFVFRKHADLVFKEHKKPVDPPKGNFTFVNRCGHTGVLLGPPNYHEYQNRLVRHHQQRVPHIPFAEFKARIQTVRDPETVKAWIESMSFKIEYEYVPNRPVSEEPQNADSPPATPPPTAEPPPAPKIFSTRDEVESYFIEHDLARLITISPEPKISGQASRRIEHGGILEAIRLAWQSERKFPLKTANGLRSRLRQNGFHFFKHHKGVTYLSIIRPKRFESLAGLTEQVQKIVTFLRANEGCTRKQLVEKIMPLTEAANDAQAGHERLRADLQWLIMEGYVVEFSDGRLWALEDKPQPPPVPERKLDPTSETAVPPASVPETPAPAEGAKVENPIASTTEENPILPPDTIAQ